MKNARKTILTYSGTLMWFTGKNQNFRKFQEYTSGTTFEPNILKKPVNEEVKMTMVDFNNKVLND